MAAFLPQEVHDAFEKQAGFSLHQRVLYACYVGSTSHNTYVPSTDPNSIDDIDIMVIVLPPLEKVAGLYPWKETEQLQIGIWDVNVHSVAKYMRLLLKGNPNMLCTLWVRPEDRLACDPLFSSLLLDHRTAFSTKEVFHSFAGYAAEQLRKMSSHENAYQGYMGEKRKRLVDRFGYDTKNAAHLIRLLTMCIEFLKTGELTIFREKDGQVYRDIKSGLWPLVQVKERAQQLAREAVEAYEASTLPTEPNARLAEEALVRLYKARW